MTREDEVRKLLRQLGKMWKEDPFWAITDYSPILLDLLEKRQPANHEEKDLIRELQELCPSYDQRQTLPELLAEECDQVDLSKGIAGQIKSAIMAFQMKRAKRLFDNNADAVDDKWYYRNREDQLKKKRDTIERYVLNDDLVTAENHLREASEQLEADEQACLDGWFRETAAEKCRQRIMTHALPLLAECLIEEAEAVVAPFRIYTDPSFYERLFKEYQIRCLLQQGAFAKAQEVYSNCEALTTEEYVNLAAPFIGTYFSNMGLDIDEHKERALATPDPTLTRISGFGFLDAKGTGFR